MVDNKSSWEIFNDVPEAIGVTRRIQVDEIKTSWIFEYVNECFCKITGYSQEELIDNFASKIYDQSEAIRLKEALKDNNGRLAEMMLNVSRKDNKNIKISFSVTPIEFDNGKPCRSIAVSRVVKEKEAIAELATTIIKSNSISSLFSDFLKISLMHTKSEVASIIMYDKSRDIFILDSLATKNEFGNIENLYIGNGENISNLVNSTDLRKSFLNSQTLYFNANPIGVMPESIFLSNRNKRFVSIPISAQINCGATSKTLGLIILGSNADYDVFNEDRRLVEDITNQLAYAILNIRYRANAELLRELNEKCRRPMNLSDTLTEYLDGTLSLLRAQGGFIVAVDKQKRVVDYKLKNMTLVSDERRSHNKLMQSIIDECVVVSTKAPYSSSKLPKADSSFLYNKYFADVYRSMASEPINYTEWLYVEGELLEEECLLGVLSVCWNIEDAFDQNDIDNLEKLASMAAASISKSTYYVAQDRLFTIAKALNENHSDYQRIVEITRKIFDSDICVLYGYDEASNQMFRLCFAAENDNAMINNLPEVCQEIPNDLLENKVIIVNDITDYMNKKGIDMPISMLSNMMHRQKDLKQIRTDINKYLAAPIFTNEKLLGTVETYRKDDKLLYNSEDLKAIKSLANYFAVYLDIDRLTDYYRIILETSPNSIIITKKITTKDKDNQWVIEYLNPSGVSMLGFENKSEVINKSVADFLSPRNLLAINSVLRDNQESFKIENRINIESEIIKKDGSQIPVSLNLASMPGGKILGICRNISKEKALIKQTIEQERLSSINKLAMGFVHDSRDSLFGITGYLSVIIDKIPRSAKEDPAVAKVIENVVKELGLLRSYFNRLPKMATFKNEPKKKLNIYEVLKGVVDLIEVRTNQAKIKIKMEKKADNYNIFGDRVQIVQLFVNLFLNSIYELKRKQSGQRQIDIVISDDSKYLNIVFQDNGPGIDPNDIPDIYTIFEPGFTTKNEKGTGYGLTTSRSIIEEHGGNISVASTFGESCKFEILFPIYARGL